MWKRVARCCIGERSFTDSSQKDKQSVHARDDSVVPSSCHDDGPGLALSSGLVAAVVVLC